MLTKRVTVLAFVAVQLWLADSSAAGQSLAKRFVALDFIGGGEFKPDPPEQGTEQPPADFHPMAGFEFGGSLRLFEKARWLGLTGSWGRRWNDDSTFRDGLGGVLVTSPALVT